MDRKEFGEQRPYFCLRCICYNIDFFIGNFLNKNIAIVKLDIFILHRQSMAIRMWIGSMIMNLGKDIKLPWVYKLELSFT